MTTTKYQEFDMFNYTSQTLFYEQQEEEEELIHVVQHLSKEQYLYEFPTKTCLKALEYLDVDEYSYFDESLSSITVLSSVYYNNNHMNWQETNNSNELVDDGRLSPLQLPAQIDTPTTVCKSNCCKEESSAVGPFTFLSEGYSFDDDDDDNNLHIFCNESVPIMDTDFDTTTTTATATTTVESHIVLIKLNKSSTSPTNISFITMDDEGYYDDDCQEELESNCVFYPIFNDDDDKRNKAAIKIQSIWRKYRKNHLLNQRQRLVKLELKLKQETAMRMAFEKAMEDMTVLIDQQQKILYDRLDQEIHLRQVIFESKLQPLESRLRKEVDARMKMEEMMTRVLDQMHKDETSRQQQYADLKKSMQTKLDKALDEIDAIKKKAVVPVSASTLIHKQQQQQPFINKQQPTSFILVNKQQPSSTTFIKKQPSSNTAVQTKQQPSNTIQKKNGSTRTVRKSIVPSSTSSLRQQQQPLNNNNKHLLLTRPSVIPSNRRPPSALDTATTTKHHRSTTRPLLTAITRK